jgi:hypothetical protein
MEKEPGIKCGIFKTQEALIKKATQAINAVQGAIPKAQEAEKLLNEVNILLTCAEYDDKNFDCQACRSIANLRKKMAELMFRASKLAR